MHGFFAEALSMAGLVVGYLVAAWQYQRLAEWLMSFLKSEMLAEIFGFLIIFFVILMVFSIAGRIARKLMKAVGLSGFDRFLGGVVGCVEGRAGGGCGPDGNDRIHTDLEVAGEVGAGAVFPGGWKGCDLGSAVGVAGEVLRRIGFPASRSQGI